MLCGSHRWSVSGPFLIIEHEVRPIERWLYRGALLLSLALPVIALTTGFFAGEVRVWIMMVALGALAVHHLTSRWKVLLNLETRSVWRRTGYRETLGAKTQPLEPFTSVALYQRDKGPTTGLFIAKVYVVALMRPSESVVLSHSDDREEAVELAQAVSRFLGMGLSVEGDRAAPLPRAWRKRHSRGNAFRTCPMAAASNSGRTPRG
ncbi:hypothetical protein [Corallococcus sp. M7]